MRKLGLLFALLLLLGLLCACGQSSPSTPTITIAAPEDRPDVFGSFKAVDLNGEHVDESVFSANKLTMVNIWGTFCSPCVKEMPELAEINREYAEKGFAIVGIPLDITDRNGVVKNDKLTEALSIVEATGADYLHIVPSREMISAKLKDCQSVPETIFLDSSGRQVGESYMGSKTKTEWIGIIDQLLKAVE